MCLFLTPEISSGADKPDSVAKVKTSVQAKQTDTTVSKAQLNSTQEALPALTDSLKSSNPEQTKPKKEFSNWIFPVSAVLFLLAAAIAGLIYFVLFLRKRIGEQEQNLSNYKRILNEKAMELNSLKKELDLLNQEFKSYTLANTKKLAEMEKFQQGKQSPVIKSELNQQEPVRQKKGEFYMSTPNSDGSFNQSSYSPTFKPTASFYRCVVQSANSQRASFFFVDDEKAVINAINYPDTYIDPVCTAENAINYSARKIKTSVPGIMEKSGDKWVLIRKAIISYE